MDPLTGWNESSPGKQPRTSSGAANGHKVPALLPAAERFHAGVGTDKTGRVFHPESDLTPRNALCLSASHPLPLNDLKKKKKKDSFAVVNHGMSHSRRRRSCGVGKPSNDAPCRWNGESHLVQESPVGGLPVSCRWSSPESKCQPREVSF